MSPPRDPSSTDGRYRAASRQAADPALALARLLRVTRDNGFSDVTRALVRDLLLEELGALRAEAPLPPSAAAQPMRQAAVAAPSAAPRVQVQPISGTTGEHLELKLRQLVEAEAGWAAIEPLAWELFAALNDEKTAARVLELAFLHGATADVDQVLGRLKRHVPTFLIGVHPAVRAHLVVRFWREGGGEHLAALLFRDKDLEYLQPVERLFVFQVLQSSKDHATAYIYFGRYREKMTEAVAELGGHLGLTSARFLLQVGTIALELGRLDEARELLAGIAAVEPEHDDALMILLTAAAAEAKAGRSHYVELMVQHADPRERLALLEKFLGATRGLGGFKDKNRPALNEILKNPLEWFGEEAEIYAALSDLIVRNRDLDGLLPNLFEVFRQNATVFASPILDGALWQGPLTSEPQSTRDLFYQGVALLHQYVNCGVAAEASLWRARDAITAARRDARAPLPCDWKDLHKAATGWVAKNRYLMESDRARMLLTMKVALDPASVVTGDVEAYLSETEAPPVHVLAKLERLAEAKNAPALEARLVQRRAELTHLTNDDLDRLWQLANQRQDSDCAWRIASVLHARRALMPGIRHAWEISGEKRASYDFVPPSKAAVERCLLGIPARAARLAYASMHIGPVLPELLAILDNGAKTERLKGHPPDSVEGRVERLLANLSWLEAPKKHFRFSFEAAGSPLPLPGFAQVLPANPWAVLVAKLSERFGVSAWGWKLSRLHGEISDLIPRLATRQDLGRHSGKVAKWLRELTPERRAAWQDLSQLTRSMDDDQAADALASFICRLATVIYENHFLALTSLQAMRAPAAVIWDLERWIVSDAYSEIRKNLHTSHRILVPNSLVRLESAVMPETAAVN